MARELLSAFMTLALGSSLTACERLAPELSDERVQRLRASLPGITEECLRIAQSAGVEALPDRADSCFEMTQPRQWRGLWRDRFEGQAFCPEPASTCSYETPEDAIWLTFGNGVRPVEGNPTGKTYLVEFVGRRTLRSGRYGHMGLFSHEIIVDNLISISPIE